MDDEAVTEHVVDVETVVRDDRSDVNRFKLESHAEFELMSHERPTRRSASTDTVMCVTRRDNQ